MKMNRTKESSVVEIRFDNEIINIENVFIGGRIAGEDGSVISFRTVSSFAMALCVSTEIGKYLIKRLMTVFIAMLSKCFDQIEPFLSYW